MIFSVNHVKNQSGDFYLATCGKVTGRGATAADAINDMKAKISAGKENKAQ